MPFQIHSPCLQNRPCRHRAKRESTQQPKTQFSQCFSSFGKRTSHAYIYRVAPACREYACTQDPAQQQGLATWLVCRVCPPLHYLQPICSDIIQQYAITTMEAAPVGVVTAVRYIGPPQIRLLGNKKDTGHSCTRRHCLVLQLLFRTDLCMPRAAWHPCLRT